MKNIHILPTDKPSRLYLGDNGNFVFGMIKTSIQSRNDDFTNQHIYITSDEEIKDIRPHGGKWQLEKGEILNKVIMTTDQDLIKNGVQAIDDEFLEWFVKNPSCEEVEIVFNNRGISGAEKILKTFGEYKIIIPKEEPKQLTDLEIAIKLEEIQREEPKEERMYSEEEVVGLLYRRSIYQNHFESDSEIRLWFEKFKKK